MKKMCFSIFVCIVFCNTVFSSEKTEDFDEQLDQQIRQNTDYWNRIKYEEKEKKRKELKETLEQGLFKSCSEINKRKQQDKLKIERLQQNIDSADQQNKLEIEKLQQNIASADQQITLRAEMFFELTDKEYK